MNADDVMLRRSLFGTPANAAGLVEKAVASDADEVFLDLEDSLAPSEKGSARAELCTTVKKHEWDETVLSYRINAIGTRWWYEDVISVLGAVGEQIDTIILPKVDTAAEVHTLSNLLEAVEINNGLEPGAIGVSVQIETAKGMTNVREILTAHDRLRAVIFGPGDYSTSIGAIGHSTSPSTVYPGHYWHYPLSRLSHAAAAANLLAIGGPSTETDDIETFRQSCTYEQMLGYDGKIVIHPNQIRAANEVFAPTREDAKRANRIVERYDDADGSSIATIDGKVIDYETYRMAMTIVEKATKAGILE